jgi:hypothetical protein
MSRWILFFITIAIGAAAGLYYGWVIEPVEYTDTSPSTMRIDYKADYVLMVAETYYIDNNLPLAIRRLAVLGDPSPEISVNNALLFAISVKPPYSQADLALMHRLANDLQSISTVPGSPTP